MRGFALWVVVSVGCGSDDVWVEIPPSHDPSKPTMGQFIDADGTPVVPTERDGWWEASMPSGGTVTVTTYFIDSPSATSSQSWTVVGVEPGDRYPLLRSRLPPPLPAGCSCHAVDLVAGDSNYSWTDPDAASVAARVITKSRGTGPFIQGIYDLEIDHETATYIPMPPPLGLSVSVSVVHCQPDEWDALRPALIAGFGCYWM